MRNHTRRQARCQVAVPPAAKKEARGSVQSVEIQSSASGFSKLSVGFCKFSVGSHLVGDRTDDATTLR